MSLMPKVRRAGLRLNRLSGYEPALASRSAAALLGEKVPPEERSSGLWVPRIFGTHSVVGGLTDEGMAVRRKLTAGILQVISFDSWDSCDLVSPLTAGAHSLVKEPWR